MSDENYIKMCDCTEIQDRWGLSDGDCVAFKNQYGRGYTVGYYPAVNQFWLPHIWLPRQEDLQAMLQPCSLAEVIQRFYEWYKVFEIHCSIKEYVSWTMTELWLAYVMHELHSKAWNGSDWVVE